MIGRTISHYRIHTKLGEGGMGVVYKAEDTKLERIVALKFVAPHLVSDETLRKRFEREAKAVAALDHPNICTVFEIDEGEGTLFYAMAFVEGATVRELIAERPLKVKQALDIATQTAEGIRAAHEKGVVHRDIKPANVMVNQNGQVKIMDFGLAQLADATATHTSSVIVGTTAYMSPEQAQGQATDRRTDVWSFGVLLYEMITGQLPFRGERPEAIIHAIKTEEPEPITALRSGVPMELEWIIRKCLAKDPAERYQHVDDLIVDLSKLRRQLESGVESRPLAASQRHIVRRHTIRNLALSGAVIIAVIAVALFGLRSFRNSTETNTHPTVKFTIKPNKLVRGSDTDIDAEVSISRDGKHIAYVESDAGQLWIRDLDQEEARIIPGATRVYQAFWSPDNQWIGYASGANLMRIPAQGGTPTPIAKIKGQFRRASWSSDGQTVVYCDDGGLFTVPTKGGTPARIIEHPHIEHPSFLDLPDGRQAILYQVFDNSAPTHAIYVQVVGEDRRRLVAPSASSNPYPAYSPSGHIVYVDGTGDSTAIWAIPFSLATLEPTGKAFPIAQHGSSPQMSRTGTLVYTDVPSDRLQLVWVDRSGNMLSTIGEPRRQNILLLSPDNRRLAVEDRQGDPDIWIYELDRGIKNRFTFDSFPEVPGAWTPSGDEITYASNRTGNFEIYSKPSNGNRDASLLFSTPQDEGPLDWSPDQKFLIYDAASRDTKRDLIYREREKGGSLGAPQVFLQTPFNEGNPRFSPDGRYVVYISDESGQPEIYVRDFPKGMNKWRISTDRGIAPRWSRESKEIFYVEQRKLMAVSLTTQPDFSAGAPTPLFERRAIQYDVSNDGKRFIILDRLISESSLSIHVVHNWFEEFRSQDAKK